MSAERLQNTVAVVAYHQISPFHLAVPCMVFGEDLARLGSVVPGPVAGDLPEPMSLGHRYVLEGSRLGSILLSRLLAERSPDLARRANAYLTESAKIEPWKRLSATLQKMPEDHASGGLAVADALAMFDLFERAWHHGASLRGEANSAD